MLKKFAAVAICAAFLCGSAFAQDAKTVIANAQKAMGDLKSITYSGAAKDVAFQQCGISSADLVCRGTHDPMRPITNYVRVIDLTAPTSRHTGGTNNPAGGGATTPAPGTFFQQVTPQQADLAQPWAGSLEFYITPWGFLRGAAASPNTFASRRRVDGKNYVVLSWNPAVKAPSGNNYLVNGYVNEQNIVDRVETWLGDNIMGDMHIVATYTGWKDFGGVMAPSKIVQTRGGWPFFEVDVTAAKANPPDLATLAPQPAGGGRGGGGGGGAPAAGGAPAGGPPRGGQGAPAGAPAAGAPGAAAAGAPAGGPPRGGQGAAPAAPAGPAAAAGAPAAGGGQRGGGAAALTVQQPPEKLGEGVFRFTTGPGSYDSLLIEFRDHLMLLEAGQSEARALAYIAEAKKMFPNKPIRYVMNTHPHADHTGGLPAMVAEGATIITHRNNEEFFERALNTPRTLLTDTLAKSPKKAKVESVGDKKVYTDGSRIVEFYHAFPAPHSNGLLIAYLPKEKVLFQGDFSLPAAGQPANDHIKALVPILEKLNLDFDRYINVHTSATPQTKAELWKAVGK